MPCNIEMKAFSTVIDQGVFEAVEYPEGEIDAMSAW